MAAAPKRMVGDAFPAAVVVVIGLVLMGCGDDKQREAGPTPEDQLGAPSGAQMALYSRARS